ncbi:hypothetical protein BOX15_Mlig001736g6, partial [Macrostomum lignano]
NPCSIDSRFKYGLKQISCQPMSSIPLPLEAAALVAATRRAYQRWTAHLMHSNAFSLSRSELEDESLDPNSNNTNSNYYYCHYYLQPRERKALKRPLSDSDLELAAVGGKRAARE